MNDDIRSTFQRFRKALNEAENEENMNKADWYDPKQNGIPYSPNDDILQTSMQTAKNQFGADFTGIKPSPMYYYRDDGDVSFSGNIPGLNDAKFQFRLKDPSGIGCFFWSEGQMILSDENIQKLSKINGVYKNWKKELTTAEDIRPMNLRTEDN